MTKMASLFAWWMNQLELNRKNVVFCGLLAFSLSAVAEGTVSSSEVTVGKIPVNLGVFVDLEGAFKEVDFKNTGNDLLEIKSIRSDCNCIIPESNVNSAKVGGIIKISFKVKPDVVSAKRSLDQVVALETNNGIIRFNVTGEVVPAISSDKESVSFLENRNDEIFGEKRNVIFRFLSKEYADAFAAENDDPRILVDLDRVDALTVKAVFSLKEVALSELMPFVSVVHFAMKGLKSRVYISVDVNFKVNGFVQPNEINLGFVKQGAKFQERVTFSSASLGKEYRIEVLDRAGFDIEIDDQSPGKYVISVSGLIDYPAGELFRKVISFRTNDPNESIIGVPLYGALPRKCCGQK